MAQRAIRMGIAMKYEMLAPWTKYVPNPLRYSWMAQDLMAMDDAEWRYELVEGITAPVASLFA